MASNNGPAPMRDALGFAVAIVGIPDRDRDGWLMDQTLRRAAEARELGVSESDAGAWATAWTDFVRLLIASSGS